MNSENKKQKLALEDLAVGQKFISEAHKVDAEQIKAFAAQFDPQPFHLDDAAAKNTLFGGLAASGWHTAGITMRLLVSGTPIQGGLIGAECDVAWPRPTRPGDTLHVEAEVIDIHPSKSKPDRGIVTIRAVTFNQHQEPVQTLVSKLLVFRRG